MKKADQSSPLKPVFAALSRHSDLVEIALREPVGMDGDDAVSDPGIRSLREFNVLRSAGQRGYRLHSKLRDFANDILQIHPAYQSLSSIGQLVEQIPMVWRELDDLRSAGDYQQADEAVAQIEQDTFDISDLVERNLRLLGLLLSTRFGNVSSLAAKASQNRYYQRQSELMANDLTRLSRAVEKVESEARERGLQSLAAMLRNTIQAQLPRWTQTLSQHQSQIRRDIFNLREVERKNVLLARTAMLLRQNPGWRGIEEPKLDDEIAPFLMSKPFVGAPLSPICMHMDPSDEDRSMKDLVRDEVRSLPKLAAVPTPAEKPAPIKRAEPKEPRAAPEKPAMQALARLAAAAIANAKEGNSKPLSVMDWRIGDTFARGMAPALWLAFTASALRPYKFRVVRVADPATQGERFCHTFSDALVMPTPDAIALFVRTLGRQLRESQTQGKPAADQAAAAQ